MRLDSDPQKVVGSALIINGIINMLSNFAVVCYQNIMRTYHNYQNSKVRRAEEDRLAAILERRKKLVAMYPGRLS